MSAPLRRWRVTVIQRVASEAVIQALDAAEAEQLGVDLWSDDPQAQFEITDSGLIDVMTEEVLP